jgi:hypothetical protein
LDPIPETLYPVLYDFSVLYGDKNVAFIFHFSIQQLSKILSLPFDGFFRSGTLGGNQTRPGSRIEAYHFLLSDNELWNFSREKDSWQACCYRICPEKGG